MSEDGHHPHSPLSGMDEESYMKRVFRFFNMMDPRTAFVTDEEIDKSLKIIKQAETGNPVPLEKLSWAQKVKDSCVHPDTGEKVLLPLRISFIVPCNLVLDLGMISATNTFSTIFWQLLNQTYNALHYYANRNASNTQTTNERLTAYLGATVSSVSVAVYLQSLGEKALPGSLIGTLAKRLAPFSAVAAADILNLSLMRKNEFLEGVDVFDPSGDFLGKSRIAGLMGVSACIFARVLAAAPILAIPPLIMHKLEQKEWLKRRLFLRTPLMLAMVGFALQVTVPFTFGIFRQTANVNVNLLEPSFHNRVQRNGERVKYVCYNKGL